MRFPSIPSFPPTLAQLAGSWLGVATASLGVVVGWEHLAPAARPAADAAASLATRQAVEQVKSLSGQNREYRAEAFGLRCEVADLKAELARRVAKDVERRRDVVRPGVGPAAGGGEAGGAGEFGADELIPPQAVPVPARGGGTK